MNPFFSNFVSSLAKSRLNVELPILAVACLTASFFGYRVWQAEQSYQSAVMALEAGQWERVRAELQQLNYPFSNYKDSETLLRESYYRPAVKGLKAEQWEKARAEFKALMQVDADYRDASNLLLETYYRPAQAYLAAQDWKNARAQLMGLLKFKSDYRDAKSLLAQAELKSATVDRDLVVPPRDIFNTWDASRYYNTGIQIAAGLEVRINASGRWGCKSSKLWGPSGHREPGWSSYRRGELIGKIGTKENSFSVGNGTTVISKGTGELLFGMFWASICNQGEEPIGSLNVHVIVIEPVAAEP